MSKDAFETLALARMYLEQGEAGLAASVYTRILQRDPGDAEAAAGLDECRRMLGRGEKAVKERKLAALKLLLARLLGEPVEGAPAATPRPAHPDDPRLRRRLILQALLEKVRGLKGAARRGGEE